jgi:hypothetical protein
MGFVQVPKASAAGTIYYVDAEYGDDSNNGASEETAWKTLDKVNATVFEPGSRLLFKAGGIWLGQLHPQGSGTAENPIIIDQFGNGSKPVIDGNGIAGETGAALFLDNQDYWEINNLSVTNDAVENVQRYGVLIRWKDYGTGNHVYLRGLDVYDVKGSLGGRFVSEGILILAAGQDVPTNYNDILIENCTLTNIDRTGISIWSQWNKRGDVNYGGDTYHRSTGAFMASTNVVIRNNSIDTTAGDGILVSVTDGALIEHNVVKNANSKDAITGANAAIWPHNSDNAVVQFNEAYLTQGTHDSMGFDIDLMNHDAIVQYNYSHENNGGFIVVCANTIANTTRDIKIRYNVSQNDRSYVFSLVGNTHNTHFYNNTIFTSANIVGNWSWNGLPDSTYYTNNIIYNTGNGGYAFSASTNNVFDYNLFYGMHPASEPEDQHKLTSNPLFVNPNVETAGWAAATGYKLQPGSPAIDSGTVIADNGGRDYSGNAVPFNNAVDRGAFEFANDTVAVPKVPLVDELNDWSKVKNHSDGLAFDNSNPEIFGDASRVIRSGANIAGDKYLIYSYTGLRHVQAKAYYNSNESLADFAFYTSNDGRSWKRQSVFEKNDSALSGGWIQRVYDLDLLPPGVNYIKIMFPAEGSSYDVPSLGEVTLSPNGNDEAAFIDDLNDWSNVYTRSTGMNFDTSNAQGFNDGSRVIRNNINQAPAEYLVYRYAGTKVSRIMATGYYKAGLVSQNFRFYVSQDAVNWTEETPDGVRDTQIMNGSWVMREFDLYDLPDGIIYVRVEFPTGGAATWNPNLGKITLNDRSVPLIQEPVIPLIDELNDWNKVCSHSSGLTFDKSNAQTFNDGSRVIRTNRNAAPAEYLVYCYTSSDVSRVMAAGYYRADSAIQDFKFYVSTDQVTWTEQTGAAVRDTAISGSWIKREYDLSILTNDIHYVRIEFPVGGVSSWNPNLGWVTINDLNVPSI